MNEDFEERHPVLLGVLFIVVTYLFIVGWLSWA